MTHKIGYAALLLASVSVAVPCAVYAQAYPQKPLRIVVPYPPGGGVDFLARPISQKLTELWGQPVVIDNRPGANGNIGTDIVAKAPADGYTLLFATVSPLAISPALYSKLPYNPVRDFAPITLLASTTAVLVVHPSLPAKTVSDLVALAKAKPRQLSYASSGSGSTNHLTTEMFAALTGAQFVHIPYKSGSQAVTDVMSGIVPFMFVNAPVALPQLNAGRLRGLAVTSAKRSVLAPNLPTLAESGVRGFDLSGTWYGALAPAGTPQEIVAKLSSTIVKLVNAPELKPRFTQAGLDVIASTPAEFLSYLEGQIAVWGKVARQAGAKVD